MCKELIAGLYIVAKSGNSVGTYVSREKAQ